MKGHRWQYSEQNGCVVAQYRLPVCVTVLRSFNFSAVLSPPGGCKCGKADLCPRQPWPAHNQSCNPNVTVLLRWHVCLQPQAAV